MTDSLFDFLTIQHTAYVLDQYRNVHGPWPININFTTPDGKRNTFKCCLYRQLHAISSTDDAYELFSPPQLADLAADFAEEAVIQEAWERYRSDYDDFCSTDLDPEM